MSNPKILSVLFTALILGLGTGYATADEMGSSMQKSDEAAMSGSMQGDMSESGASMNNSGDSDMSESMSEDSAGMDGDMSDEESSMGESPSMDEN